MRLGKRERREARKASGFDQRKALVAVNLSSPIARTNDRGLVNSSQSTVLGSKSARFNDTRVKGHIDKPVIMARHRYVITDQFGDTWGGHDRSKEASAMCDSLNRWPDHRAKGRSFKVVDTAN